MRLMIPVLLLLTMACVVVGCGEKSQSPTIVSVNGKTLTHADVEAQIGLRVKLLQHKMSGAPIKRLNDFTNQLHATAVQNFVRKTLLADYAEKNGLSIGESELNAACETNASYFGYANVASLRADVTAAEARAFDSACRLDLFAQKGERHLRDSVKAKISDADVDTAFVELKDINRRAVATNGVIYALAKNVYRQVASGALDFQEAVQRYSQESAKVGSGLWGMFSPSDLRARNPQLAKRLEEGVKENDILPPIEADNALLVCKVGESRDGKWLLRRIVFLLAQVWNTPTRDKMRQTLAENREREAFRARTKELYQSAEILYPQANVK